MCAIESADLEQFRDWRNNPDTRKYFREFRELNMHHQKTWFTDKVMNDPSTLMFAVRRTKDNQLLGCCGLAYINWVNRHAELSIYIGWKDEYIDKTGYAEESCNLLIKYGFEEISLNKIWTEIYEFDDRKTSLFSQLGFQKDGLLRQHYWHRGKWWNSIIYSLLMDDKS